MPKQNKPIAKLKAVPIQYLLLSAAAVLCIAGAVCITEYSEWNSWVILLAALLLFVIGSALILRYSGHYGARGADSQLVTPVLGNLMLETVMHQSSPAFICDAAEERIIWYNHALSAVCRSTTQLYGHRADEFLNHNIASVLDDGLPEGAAAMIDDHSFRLKVTSFRAKEKEFFLVILNDVTEREELYTRIAQREAVIAYIMIDNLDDMVQYEQDKFRSVYTQVENVLREWAEQTNGILKEYERDRYLFVFEARHLDECIVRRFDILDRIRDIRVGEGKLPVTISIGVANVSGEFNEKERAAGAALDMALQRGGDQVVVKTESGIEFYGGRTKTVQKRTKVRSRVIANELIMLMSRASNVIVMGHKYADFDAFGAAVGIARLAMFCGTDVNIVTDMQDPNLALCRRMLGEIPDYMNVLVDTRESLELVGANSLLVLVDVNNAAIYENAELAQNVANIVVIDHHRKTAEFDKNPLISYIEPSASSASELVAEMLEQVLPEELLLRTEANLLLGGILVDTKQFVKNTGSRTFSAALYLRDRGASPAEAQKLFHTNLDDFIREGKFRSNVVVYRGITAIALGDGEGDAGDRIAAAKAADKLLSVEGVQASFALVRIGDTVHISARSTDTVNVQVILEKLRGGGHFDAAGAQVSGTTLQEALVQLKAAIDSYFDGDNNHAEA